MDFRHQISSLAGLASFACDALLVIVPGDAAEAAFDGPVAAALNDAVEQGEFKLKAGKSIGLLRAAGVRAPRLVFAATGSTTGPATDAANGAPTLKAFKAAVAQAIGQIKEGGAKHVAIALAGAAEEPGELGPARAAAIVEAAFDATYLYRHTKPSAPPAPAVSKVTVLCAKADAKAVQQGLAQGRAIAAGVALARECANRPANHCTPTFLADEARKLGKEFDLDVEVLGRKEVEKLGMGAFLAVAQGSEEPLRFIVARYDGAAKSEPPIVLVGKGITFDSGGISIKPSADMDEMKYDMGGAASVLGTLRAVAELKPKINLVCVIPSCENMLSGRAVKPGDVVTTLSGQTVEILNTDAEGRLILCDALTYVERFKPAMVIDVATLTGACVVALGHHHSGLFTADDALAAELLAASRNGLDPCWRMPLDEEYGEGLKSNFADMPNIGGRPGGAITAAIFLSRFTGKYRWAHLDVAGTAWKSGSAKGSTGRPVPLLTHFVLAQAA